MKKILVGLVLLIASGAGAQTATHTPTSTLTSTSTRTPTSTSTRTPTLTPTRTPSPTPTFNSTPRVVSLATQTPIPIQIPGVGASVSVPLELNNGNSVDAVTVGINYDPAILGVTGVTFSVPCFGAANFGTDGEICIAIACTTGTLAGQTNITLAQITFLGETVGTSVAMFGAVGGGCSSDPSGCLLESSGPNQPSCLEVNTSIQVLAGATSTPTHTPTSTPTLTPTVTNTPTWTPTPSPTNTSTRTSTQTPTITITRTPTLTPTITKTPPSTLTPTPTPTGIACCESFDGLSNCTVPVTGGSCPTPAATQTPPYVLCTGCVCNEVP